jgi:hypothetical protein
VPNVVVVALLVLNVVVLDVVVLNNVVVLKLVANVVVLDVVVLNDVMVETDVAVGLEVPNEVAFKNVVTLENTVVVGLEVAVVVEVPIDVCLKNVVILENTVVVGLEVAVSVNTFVRNEVVRDVEVIGPKHSSAQMPPKFSQDGSQVQPIAKETDLSSLQEAKSGYSTYGKVGCVRYVVDLAVDLWNTVVVSNTVVVLFDVAVLLDVAVSKKVT